METTKTFKECREITITKQTQNFRVTTFLDFNIPNYTVYSLSFANILCKDIIESIVISSRGKKYKLHDNETYFIFHVNGFTDIEIEFIGFRDDKVVEIIFDIELYRFEDVRDIWKCSNREWITRVCV